MNRSSLTVLVFLFSFSAHAEGLNCPEGTKADKIEFKGGGWQDYCELIRNGKKILHGPSKGYHVDGTLSFSGQYKNGVPDGKSLSWHPNGQLRYEEVSKDGKRIVFKEWDEKGNIIRK